MTSEGNQYHPQTVPAPPRVGPPPAVAMPNMGLNSPGQHDFSHGAALGELIDGAAGII